MENDDIVKIVVAVIILIGVMALGGLIIFYVLPVFVVGFIINFFMKSSYDEKLKQVKAGGAIFVGPQLHEFDAWVLDGDPVVTWKASLPSGARLEIFRMQDQVYGTVAEVEEHGTCIHSLTGAGSILNEGHLNDHDAPNGTLFYVPIISGMVIEKKPLDYHFFDFSREVQYSERKNAMAACGNAIRVRNLEVMYEPLGLPDDRDDVAKMAEGILQSFAERKTLNTQLDREIEKINQSDELSDAEKREAIEYLETRIGER